MAATRSLQLHAAFANRKIFGSYHPPSSAYVENRIKEKFERTAGDQCRTGTAPLRNAASTFPGMAHLVMATQDWSL